MLTRLLLAAAGGTGSFPSRTTPNQGQALPGPLVKYAGNPIVLNNLSWKSNNASDPDVKWDERLSKWVMVYSGNDGTTWRTGVAYADSLFGPWTDEATNPVFEPNVDEGYIAGNGSWVYHGGQYWLYYQGGGTGALSDAPRTYAATSPDLLTWTRANGGDPILDLGATGEFDDLRTYDPTALIASDGTIVLFYVGSKDDPGNPNSGIGWASSSDGVTFTKHGRLLEPSSPELPGWIGAPTWLGADDSPGYYAFFADGAQVAFDRYINRYYTTDAGSSFTRELGVIEPGTGWESAVTFGAWQLWHNGTLYVFYSGGTNNDEPLNAQIGVATLAWP